LAAVGGGSAPGAATPAAPSSGVPATAAAGKAANTTVIAHRLSCPRLASFLRDGDTGAGTGSGSKATPTAPFLTSGGASVRGAVSLALAFAAVAVYAISAV
jgi:hypothetical protein